MIPSFDYLVAESQTDKSQILTTISVCLRLYVRFFVSKSPGYDDYIIIINFV